MRALRFNVIARSALIRRSPPSGEGGCDEAIHLANRHRCEMDCFAEPVIGRRFAPTRWLAMTTGSRTKKPAVIGDGRLLSACRKFCGRTRTQRLLKLFEGMGVQTPEEVT
jgi:hypothetical protein